MSKFKAEALETVLGNVLPDNAPLCKDCGTWHFYKSEEDFDNGDEFTYQGIDEPFIEFISRTLEKLMIEENGEEFPSVQIDFAIYVTGKGLEL